MFEAFVLQPWIFVVCLICRVSVACCIKHSQFQFYYLSEALLLFTLSLQTDKCQNASQKQIDLQLRMVYLHGTNNRKHKKNDKNLTQQNNRNCVEFKSLEQINLIKIALSL